MFCHFQAHEETTHAHRFRTFPSLFTLEKSQCRGVDLHVQVSLPNPYDEQPGIALKGDNLARMLALRSGTNMLNVERLADEMITYGLVRFGKQSVTRNDERECGMFIPRRMRSDQ